MQNMAPERVNGSMLFIQKVHKILSNPEYQDIICWNTAGTIFTICSQECFCEEVLPQNFKHRKMESFVRQLNIYGFKKVKKQISLNSFKHPSFLRDSPSLLKSIKRRVKSRKYLLSAEEEQNQEQPFNLHPVTGSKNDSITCEKSEGNPEKKEENNQQEDGCIFQGQNYYNENYLFTNRSLTDWDVPMVEMEY